MLQLNLQASSQLLSSNFYIHNTIGFSFSHFQDGEERYLHRRAGRNERA